MKKKTSYQKLKEENEILKIRLEEYKRDIYNLVIKENEKNSAMSDVKWRTIFSIEDVLNNL